MKNIFLLLWKFLYLKSCGKKSNFLCFPTQIHNYFFKFHVGYHNPCLVAEVQSIKLPFKIFSKGTRAKRNRPHFTSSEIAGALDYWFFFFKFHFEWLFQMCKLRDKASISPKLNKTCKLLGGTTERKPIPESNSSESVRAEPCSTTFQHSYQPLQWKREGSRFSSLLTAGLSCQQLKCMLHIFCMFANTKGFTEQGSL